MHFQAILAHLILLLSCDSFMAVASPAVGMEKDDIFLKRNPCMVKDVLASVLLRLNGLWKANTTAQSH